MDRSIAIQERQASTQLEDKRQEAIQEAQAKAQAVLDQAKSSRDTVQEMLGGPLVGEAMNRILKSNYIGKGLKKIGITDEDIQELTKIGSKEDLLNFMKKKGAGKASKMIEQLKAKAKNIELSDSVQNKIQSLPDKTDGKSSKVDTKDPVVNDTDDILTKTKELDGRYDNLTEEGKSYVDGVTSNLTKMNNSDDAKNYLVNREQEIKVQEDSGQMIDPGTLPEVDDPNSVFDDMTDIPKAVNNLPSKPSIFSNTDNILSDAKKTGTDLANSASDALSDITSKATGEVTDAVTGTLSDLAEGAVASGAGLDPITDAIGLFAGLGSVLSGALDTADKAAPVNIPNVGSTYTGGVF